MLYNLCDQWFCVNNRHFFSHLSAVYHFTLKVLIDAPNVYFPFPGEKLKAWCCHRVFGHVLVSIMGVLTGAWLVFSLKGRYFWRWLNHELSAGGQKQSAVSCFTAVCADVCLRVLGSTLMMERLLFLLRARFFFVCVFFLKVQIKEECHLMSETCYFCTRRQSELYVHLCSAALPSH